jgi:Fe-S-cluster containining protein
MLSLVNGVRFACRPGCTSCCRVRGYVYLTEDDLRRAAAFLGVNQRSFERRYIYRTRHLLRLRKTRNAQCHFLQDGGCSIHPAKPTQCSAFPFWPELVGSRSGWRQLRTYCPGIGKGDFIPVQAVQRIANRMREAYPAMYP